VRGESLARKRITPSKRKKPIRRGSFAAQHQEQEKENVEEKKTRHFLETLLLGSGKSNARTANKIIDTGLPPKRSGGGGNFGLNKIACRKNSWGEGVEMTTKEEWESRKKGTFT